MTDTSAERRNVLRMLDANLNRLSEGLRTIEDVFRFAYDSASVSGEARRLRHAFARVLVNEVSREVLVKYRRSKTDVGAGRWRGGMLRLGLSDLVVANFRRAQESARVLEEGVRLLYSGAMVRRLQSLRYRVYELESRAWRVAARKRSKR